MEQKVISFIKETDMTRKNSQAVLTANLLLYDSVVNKYILTI